LELSPDKINEKGYTPVVVAHTEDCIGCSTCGLVCPDCVLTVENDLPQRPKPQNTVEMVPAEKKEPQKSKVVPGKKYLMKGNEAIAQAAILAGCRCYFGYPITPQTEIAAFMAKRMALEGGVYLQAESELAAMNMVLGAASTGTRAMTSSSSPGISLKTEAISYMGGSDLPCLIVDVMRGGPGLGSIQPSQSDYWQVTKAMGHGDFKRLVYAPASVQEAVDMVGLAFEKAETYRMPAVLLADGLIGQMMEPVSFPEPVAMPLAEKKWATTGTKEERNPNIINSLFLQADILEGLVDRRFERYAIAEQNEVLYDTFLMEDAQYAIVAFGACARVAHTAITMARENGIRIGLLRPKTLWPYPKDAVLAAAKQCDALLTVEMNKGQMVEDVDHYAAGNCPVYFYGRNGGVIPTPEEVYHKILEIVNGK
jgi:2-oxoglutarate ferredoxin oxidoreductase subunit alpha